MKSTLVPDISMGVQSRVYMLALALLCLIGFETQAVGGTYINFDVPNAVDTQGWGVNNGGHVVGVYFDGSTNHCFIRHPSGFILTFDVPGSIGTVAYGINAYPNVVGYYFNADYVGHGFIRKPGNRYTHVDVPGAGTLAGQGTYAYYIND